MSMIKAVKEETAQQEALRSAAPSTPPKDDD
jgi:hypothetical protein